VPIAVTFTASLTGTAKTYEGDFILDLCAKTRVLSSQTSCGTCSYTLLCQDVPVCDCMIQNNLENSVRINLI